MNDHALSKYLSYVLRHAPEDLGLALDAGGWLETEALLQALKQRKGWNVTLDDLQRVVREDPKTRYALAAGKIRANQGHSLPVDQLELTEALPPKGLLHGTTRQRWERIQSSGGLRPMNRHHVHLAQDEKTARAVAGRWRSETPLLLEVDAAAMVERGLRFWRSANGVWLCDEVPLEFLKPLENS